MVDIVRVPNVDEAAAAIMQRLGTSKLVRVEGFCGVGKTRVARQLAKIAGAIHIATDSFAFRPDRPSPYRDCIKRPELATEIERAIAKGDMVVLDGVCLDEIAPQSEWGRGLLVYVKRLSLQSGAPIWHDGIDLEEGEVPRDEPGRSVFLYNANVRPDHRADLILEMPEEFEPPGIVRRWLGQLGGHEHERERVIYRNGDGKAGPTNDAARHTGGRRIRERASVEETRSRAR